MTQPTSTHISTSAGVRSTSDVLPFVTVVVCTHNRREELQRYALTSLRRLAYPSFEVVVVDDCSTDGTVEVIPDFADKIPRLRYVRNDKHRSLCHVRNLGIAHASGDVIVFIDDDCLVEPDWLTELVRPYLEDEQVMAVAGRVLRGDTIEEQRPPVGCNMSFRATVFDSLRFDTNLTYSHWFDEVDLFESLKQRKWRVAIAHNATVRHYVARSVFRPDKIGRSLNALYFYAKRHSLLRYYAVVLAFSGFFLRGAQRPSSWISKHASRMALRPLLAELRRNPRISRPRSRFLWVYYVLLLQIPYRSLRWKWLNRRTGVPRSPRGQPLAANS